MHCKEIFYDNIDSFVWAYLYARLIKKPTGFHTIEQMEKEITNTSASIKGYLRSNNISLGRALKTLKIEIDQAARIEEEDILKKRSPIRRRRRLYPPFDALSRVNRIEAKRRNQVKQG